MHEVLQELPSIESLLVADSCQPCFLEVFAGKAVLTMAMVAMSVPCAKPWDVVYGEQFDVLKHGEVLIDAVKAGRVAHMHFGTPCQSMTWARNPQLRSEEWPLGKQGLSNKQSLLVRRGSALVAFTVKLCLLLWSVGATFSVENPELSWLWRLPGLLQLRALAGVQFVRIRFCNFKVPFFKPTLFWHNVPTWHRAGLKTVPWRRPLIRLWGQVWTEGRWVFKTKLSQTYPPLLCLRLAELMQEGWGAQAGAHACAGFMLPTLLHESLDPKATELDPALVPQGLGAMCGLDPWQHVAFATRISHPSETPKMLDSDLVDAINFECQASLEQIHNLRERQLRQILHVAEQLEDDRVLWLQGVPSELRKLAKHIHGPLWKCLLAMAGIESEEFLADLQRGFVLWASFRFVKAQPKNMASRRA